jgi:hypothetical protein
VPAATALEDIEEAVAKMLLPYKESGCGDEDPPELKQYLKFEDDEDEYVEKYATDTTPCFVDPAGKPHSKYSEEFRSRPRDIFAQAEYICPAGWTAREVPVKELYPIFEQYMADYCGYDERDPQTSRYGRWRNPNQKWDWWKMGGRWTGFIPVKAEAAAVSGSPGLMTAPNRDPLKADACRIASIDFDTAAAQMRQRAEEFWTEWQQFADGKEFPAFEGPRDKALRLGLLTCKNADELTGGEWKTVKWGRQNTPGVDRFDVLANVAREDFMTKCLGNFFPLLTYARLDAAGWVEPGSMGWFGFSSDTPETNLKHAADFPTWLRAGDQQDWLVVVDCHI